MSEAVSLTTFVDFVCKAGTPKATVVRTWRHRDDYSVATDYYKRIRDAIVEFHKSGASVGDVARAASENKQENYEAIWQGHRRWVGRKRLSWFEPPATVWTSGTLTVSVNPELGLVVNDVPHLVKLYFKADTLTKNRIDLITHLMNIRLARSAPAHCVMGVLDVRNYKLIAPTVPVPGLTAQLEAEAAYWNVLWPNV